MSVRFTVEIQGKTELSRAFNRVSAEISDWRKVWAPVRAWLKSRLRRQFDAEGTPNKWARLSPEYAKWKEVHYPGAKILERTGYLKESLTDGNADTIDRETDTLFEYGTRTPYGKYHQDGGTRLRQRKIFDFDDEDRRSLTEEMQRPLVEIVRAQGFEVFEF
jgi:phage gpG-like protein